jgi:hypothetical protein
VSYVSCQLRMHAIIDFAIAMRFQTSARALILARNRHRICIATSVVSTDDVVVVVRSEQTSLKRENASNRKSASRFSSYRQTRPRVPKDRPVHRRRSAASSRHPASRVACALKLHRRCRLRVHVHVLNLRPATSRLSIFIIVPPSCRLDGEVILP